MLLIIINSVAVYLRCSAPPSYDTEKFVRTSHDVNRLVETANCFYQKSSPPTEAWICLEIDTMGLGMNQIETKMVPSETVPDLKCPHVYGKIPEETVRNIYQVQRDASTGEFSIITGLTDTCALHPSNK